MSRHRNIRNISLEDELSEDVYGRSLDDTDNYCVSPATEAEFMFRRDKHHTLSSFIGDNERIEEEVDDNIDDEDDDLLEKVAETFQKPVLDHITEARLQQCMEQLEDILGDQYDQNHVTEVILSNHFDVEKALNELLSNGRQDSTRSKNLGGRTEYFTGTSNYVIATPKTKPPEKLFSKVESRNSSGSSTPKGSSRSQSRENLLDESSSLSSLINSSSKTKLNRTKENIDVQAELKKRQDGKELINMVVIGHVDAGKSTLMGHLLFDLGNVSKKVMHRNEVESKKFGKGSFAFAWVLDETEEERSRGITMDVAMTMFETKAKIITLMDAPGHRDFIPNMIQGTSQADVAILVVDSRPGEFEAGFEAGGQTREHAILARSLGVSQVIVAINKMDAIGWQKDRYDAIVLKLKSFLTKNAGFREADVFYVPCSGLSGENLTSGSKEKLLKSWYHGESVVELIDLFKAPKRPVDRPFRLCISDVYKGQGSFMVCGKVESGSVQNGDRVLFMPAGETGMIKGLTTREENVKFAAAGDHVTASIHGVDMAHASVGNVICEIDNPIKVTSRIVARIVVFNVKVPITKGFMVVFHSQNASDPALISKLVSILNKSSGEVVQKRPRCLTKHMNAVIEVKFPRPICIECYCDNKVLGRFMLRYSGKTIAAGVVTEIKSGG